MAAAYVYILANRAGGAIIVASTSDLVRRVQEQRTAAIPGFTATGDVARLVWFETCDFLEQALHREKLLTGWNRAWTVQLIEAQNPDWDDLYPSIATGS
jgi:putative endonuclease